ncbi:MAG TPA: hypothetical protein PKA88_06505 [Polyangiaceae bacterium]|nr:hypothetical protein [Polyangiaceae bacterium]
MTRQCPKRKRPTSSLLASCNRASVGPAVGLALVVAATAAVACDKKEPPAPPAGAAASGFTEIDKVALMERHYTAAITGHDALIRGDLEKLRTELSALSTQNLPDKAPAGWKTMHDKMRAAATSGKSAKTTEDARKAMARVVESCGGCHEQQVRGPVYQRPTAPEGGTPLQTDMLHHQWATERLWEGVTGPWDDAWLRGAQAIAKADVFRPEAGAVSDELRRKEAELRALGAEAGKASGLVARATTYGKILATCAACHTQVGVNMKPAKN